MIDQNLVNWCSFLYISILFSPRKYELSQVLDMRGDGLAGALFPRAFLTTATMQTRALLRAQSAGRCHVEGCEWAELLLQKWESGESPPKGDV